MLIIINFYFAKNKKNNIQITAKNDFAFGQ